MRFAGSAGRGGTPQPVYAEQKYNHAPTVAMPKTSPAVYTATLSAVDGTSRNPACAAAQPPLVTSSAASPRRVSGSSTCATRDNPATHASADTPNIAT